jgi:integrase
LRRCATSPIRVRSRVAGGCRHRRLKLGLGGVGAEDLIFADAAGNLPSPDNVSRDWVRLRRRLGLSHIRVDDLRHTSVSVLVRDNIDPATIARRLGHGSASFTLRQYAHLFNPDDRRSANALGAALRGHATEAAAAADSVDPQQAARS